MLPFAPIGGPIAVVVLVTDVGSVVLEILSSRFRSAGFDKEVLGLGGGDIPDGFFMVDNAAVDPGLDVAVDPVAFLDSSLKSDVVELGVSQV